VDNPFERYDLDPRDGIAAITARLKELAEDAKDDAERERIRAAWEELTLHPARRLRAALFAHPETRLGLGTPPIVARRTARGAGGARGTLETIASFEALAPWPSLVVALGVDIGSPRRAHLGDAPPLDDDPCL
jgi:hypothetical protein